MELPSVYRLVHLTVRTSVHLNSSCTGSSVEEDLENTETGTWNEYKRFAISDYNYAAKELCGPIAYTTGRNRRLAAYRLEKASRRDEEISQLFDDGRTSR